MGGRGGNSSGDIFIAFSTANPEVSKDDGLVHLEMLPNEKINPLFEAAAAATEEAIVNAMLAAPASMTGADGIRIHGLPGPRVVEAMKKYGRMR